MARKKVVTAASKVQEVQEEEEVLEEEVEGEVGLVHLLACMTFTDYSNPIPGLLIVQMALEIWGFFDSRNVGLYDLIFMDQLLRDLWAKADMI